MDIKKHLEILGFRVTDKVTGLTGVAVSVSFDLYGCIQVIVNPGLDKDGKMGESVWYDKNRLVIIGNQRVMEPPNFDVGPVIEGKQGAAEKPSYFKA